MKEKIFLIGMSASLFFMQFASADPISYVCKGAADAVSQYKVDLYISEGFAVGNLIAGEPQIPLPSFNIRCNTLDLEYVPGKPIKCLQKSRPKIEFSDIWFDSAILYVIIGGPFRMDMYECKTKQLYSATAR